MLLDMHVVHDVNAPPPVEKQTSETAPQLPSRSTNGVCCYRYTWCIKQLYFFFTIDVQQSLDTLVDMISVDLEGIEETTPTSPFEESSILSPPFTVDND